MASTPRWTNTDTYGVFICIQILRPNKNLAWIFSHGTRNFIFYQRIMLFFDLILGDKILLQIRTYSSHLVAYLCVEFIYIYGMLV
jgi:hypothetical protein